MIQLPFILKETAKDYWKRWQLRYVPLPQKHEEDEAHLHAAMKWLKNAFENGYGGASSHYDLLLGKWRYPFPETTGYIIPTFFNYFNFSGERFYFDAAVQMTDWLIQVQLDSGACIQGEYEKNRIGNPVIFNTGQNMFGFLRSYRETGEKRYLDHAVKAGDFLIKSVDEHGIWNKHLHRNIPHTYNSRTAWALLELHREIQKEEYKKIAQANLDWTVGQQLPNGWFNNANFKSREYPNTHGIAYTIRGLLESSLILNNEIYFRSAQKTAVRFMRRFETNHWLHTFWDKKWKSHGKYFKKRKGSYSCLSGNIQLALVWMKLFRKSQDHRLINAAFKMIDHIKSLQITDYKRDGICGGIKGAFPLNGSYSFLKYPNWAAKFFSDALMMKIQLQKDLLK